MNPLASHFARLVAIATVVALTPVRPIAQATVVADTPAKPPIFERTKVAWTLYLERQGIEVNSELDTEGRATGRFAVFSIWPLGRNFLASYTDDAYDQPSVAFVGNGRPGVVLLASYTGGLGRDRIPNYSFKLLVLRDFESAEAFSIVPKAFPRFPSADVTSFSRTGDGFALAIKDGPQLSYSSGRLVLK
jgi:hypothetical protein